MLPLKHYLCFMTDKERDYYMKKLELFDKKVNKNDASRTKFLVEMGVLTPKGRIAKRYKDVLCLGK